MMEKDKKVNIGFIGYIILVFVLLISALLVSILIGEAKISFSTIMDAIFHYNPKNQQHNIISEIRIPRDLGAVLVGMALSVAGAVIQGVTKTDLRSKFNWFKLWGFICIGVNICFYPAAPFLMLMCAGFLGAMLGGFIVLTIGRSRRDGFNPMRIILAGAAVSALLTALSQGIALTFKLNQTLTFWTAGGVSGTTWKQLMWSGPVIIIAIIIIIAMSKQLTILNLGETLAKGLGQNITLIRGVSLFLTMILAG